MAKRKVKTFSDWEEEILRTGNYVEGTKLSNLRKVNGTDWLDIWCPTCETDVYSKHGIGCGNFSARAIRLKGNHKPCRCSGNAKCKTEAQHILDLSLHPKFPKTYKVVSLSKGIATILCGSCEEDTYSQNKVGNGVFKVSKHGLTRGNKPCRCSKAHRLTEIQHKFRVTSLGMIKGFDLLYFEKGDITSESKVKLLCNKCKTTFNPRYRDLIHNDSGCPVCSSRGYDINKEGSLYFHTVRLMDRCLIKFGITNRTPEERIKDYKIKLPINNIHDFRYSDGKMALYLENLIKDNIPTVDILRDYMDNGFTEVFEVEHLPEVMLLLRPYYKLTKELG